MLLELLGGSWASGSGPLYRRLADRMDELILSTELRDGVQLPPERTIADTLQVSRSTVVSTLDLLRERGSVVSKQGSGTRVKGPRPPNEEPAKFHSRSIFQGPEGDGIADLTKACTGMLDGVDQLCRELIADGLDFDLGMDPEGNLALREALAQWYTDDGLRTDPGDILITSGAQQGMTLTLSVLVRPGDVVLVESSVWPGLTDSINRLGGKPIGVRMDQHGVDTAELLSAVERFRPAAIALNPHHHNPTATRLSPQRRAEVARISADYRVPVLEDRVAAALAFDGVVAKPLAAERPDAALITVDSLSKVVWPGLRLGWVRANQTIFSELRLAKAINDMWTSNLCQALGLELLKKLPELLPQRITELTANMELAADLMRTHMPDWNVQRPDGGMIIWAELPQPVARQLAHHAASQGVRIAQPDAFSVEGSIPNRVRVPFTNSPEKLTEGITRLGAAWRTLDPSVPVSPGPERQLVF